MSITGLWPWAAVGQATSPNSPSTETVPHRGDYKFAPPIAMLRPHVLALAPPDALAPFHTFPDETHGSHTSVLSPAQDSSRRNVSV